MLKIGKDSLERTYVKVLQADPVSPLVAKPVWNGLVFLVKQHSGSF